MASRYDNRSVAINNDDAYVDVFHKRGVRFIRQYRTPTLRYPTAEEINTLEELAHIWSTGDRYYKLAYEHYGDARLWWVIAHYNIKPTEFHMRLGDTVYIPFPLERVLQYIDA